MGAVIPNRAAIHKAALSSIEALEKRFAANVEALVHEVDTRIKALTPVYSGLAVRNYIWSMGEGSSIVHAAINNGPTGFTSQMTLGAEPRRGPNEEAAARSLSRLSFKSPFHTYTLTNNAPDIYGLELGVLPGAPLSSRSPNGMFGIVSALVNSKIAAKGMLS